MSQLYGILGFADGDTTPVNRVGQRVIYDAMQQLLGEHNQDLQQALSVFVEETTPDYKFVYKLSGGGYMQRRGGLAQTAAVKRTGQWEVSFPLEDFGDSLGSSDIAMAYMTLKDLDLHLDTIQKRDINTVRLEVLKALFNHQVYNFVDERRGVLTVQPLANGDATLYPPLVGEENETTHSHYLESGYVAADLSDTNNPYATIRDHFEHHFGELSSGDNVVVFINKAQTPKTEVLTDYVEIGDRHIIPGANMPQVVGLPERLPGRVIGRINNVWVVEWSRVPAGYLLGIYLEAPKPLIQRVDPPETGLGTGLQLVAREETHPLEASFWRNRYGFGVGNRLNGVVMKLSASGGYTTPTTFQR